MALGKPVLTFLHDEAVRRTEEAYGVAGADRQRDAGDAPGAARGARRARRRRSGDEIGQRVARVRRARPRPRARHRPARRALRERPRALACARDGADPRPRRPPRRARRSRSATGTSTHRSPHAPAPAPAPQAMPAGLGAQLRRLGRHSAIYGIGGLVSRVIAVLLLPLYTHYLTPDRLREDRDAARPDDRDGAHPARRDHERVLPLLLRRRRRRRHAGASSARRSGSRWAAATLGLALLLLFAEPVSELLFGTTTPPNLVRAAGVALWATVNYEQLTALFRVEERSVAFVCASLANVFLTIGLTLLLVVVLEKGPIGVIVGNFSGTLIVYLSLLGYRREQLGLEFDRGLLREMNRFGIPLVPTALFLWMTNFSDRFFLVWLADVAEAGLYSVGVRDRVGDGAPADGVPHGLARVRVLDPRRAARRGGRTPTCSRTSPSSPPGSRSRSALLAPWLVDLLADDAFAEASERRRAARVLDRGVRRLHRRRDRRRPRAADAVQLGRHRDRGGGQRRPEPRR